VNKIAQLAKCILLYVYSLQQLLQLLSCPSTNKSLYNLFNKLAK